jgi:ribosomal protein S18 acetylase RimI-like enzyme
VVGYLTGCADTKSAPTLEKIIGPIIGKNGLLIRPGTAGFFYRAMMDVIRDKDKADGGGFIDERWPSHLHINLLPYARGAGLASTLMERWFAHLKELQSPGCHLSITAENTRAISFFEKMGFEKYRSPSKIPGMRGRNGERLHQQIMVRKI